MHKILIIETHNSLWNNIKDRVMTILRNKRASVMLSHKEPCGLNNTQVLESYGVDDLPGESQLPAIYFVSANGHESQKLLSATPDSAINFISSLI